VLALRLAGHRNAVSRLHGVVTRTMWRGLWPRVPVHEIPVGSVTNGVHLHTWASPEMASVLAGVLGAEWEIHTTDPRAWDAVRSVPLERLWEVRNQQRARLVERAQGWLALQQARRSMSSDPSASRERLDPDVLTIGFVGRFVAYKRPTLFLTDRERLVRLLGDATRPVQIVFAGRAHPNDFAGKGLLREVVRFAREAGLSHRIVFLENFDVAMDHWLSEGVDVWLNTSRRPDEACGIAGMKAGINGALNLSTLDGWWDEVWDEHAARARPPIGWAIGSREVPADPDAQDLADAASLYDLLEHEVRDAFYDRDPDGIPRRWVASIRESIATFGPLWTSSRMVREYTSSYYVPGTTRSASLGERRAARARDGARHLTRLARAWPDVRVGRVDARRDGRGVSVRAEVWLGKLTPRDVAVQLWVDRGDDDARAAPDPMEPERPGSGPRVFRTRLPASALPPDAVLAVRVLPTHPSIDDPLSTGLVAWSG
jgi:starch phosphorylase